jgi:hypothetical protein
VRSDLPDHQPAALLGPACPRCGAASRSNGSGGSIPLCRCSPIGDWKFGDHDRTEWYREPRDSDWRQLSTAEAQMRHTKEAAGAVIVRRVAK